MMYLLALALAGALGYWAVRLFTQRLNPYLHILLGVGLGFGIIAQLGFYVHILCGQFNHFLTPTLSLALLGALIFWNSKKVGTSTTFIIEQQDWIGFGVLAFLSIPIVLEAFHYPLGGWDAWSCWNLKAKFIYLGGDQWKNMLDPVLWRSNTHYPLLLPLMNVWFWQWMGSAQDIAPMFNAIVFTLTTAGLLYWSLCFFTHQRFMAAAVTVLVFAIPLNVTLSISQYSDILLGLYALSAIVCLLLAEREKQPSLKILSMVFLGLLSFTKTEGTVAAGILFVLYFFFDAKKKDWPNALTAFALAAIPTVIFTLFLAPKNAAFVNGLLSADKPSNYARLVPIALCPLLEFISIKWNGLWILMIGALIMAGRKAWNGYLKMIGIFVIWYLAIVLAYYFVNTFFPIVWWIQTTLNRILFALIPTIALWLGLALGTPEQEKSVAKVKPQQRIK